MADLIESEDENREEQLELYSPTSDGIGNILINPDVIARIAGRAALDIDGVSLGSKSWVAEILPSKEVVKGIKVRRNESGRYSIDCKVKMAYGKPMAQTAELLQRHVKEAVERMAGLELETVDVAIEDIYIVEKEKEGEEED